MSTLGRWAQTLKRDIGALILAARDPRVPRLAKLVAGGVVAYALSPIDLIPDFIPVLGFVDDLIILPLGVWLALRLIPSPLMTEFRASALLDADRPGDRRAAFAIVALWLVSALLFCLWIIKRAI